jgi:hypothetical protein
MVRNSMQTTIVTAPILEEGSFWLVVSLNYHIF